MGRAPCCDKAKVKKGPWSPEEDATLKDYIEKHGTGGNWIALPHKVGLKRCGKSCRLRWLNYLRPNIKHGEFSEDEDTIICTLFASIGSRWSIIAAQLPGRTDNDIKNYWNTKLKKKLMSTMAPSISPQLYQKRPHNNNNNNQITTFSSNQPFLQNYPSLFNNSQLPVYHHEPVFPSNSDEFVGHLQGNNYFNNQVIINKDSKKNNLITFGGHEPNSCSSSDGSCITNQISRNRKEFEPDYRFFQSFLGNGVDQESIDDQKFMLNSSTDDNGCFVGGDQINSLDHSIEEIKQLISTANHNMCSSSSNSLNFFLDDQIKIEDSVLDY